MRRRKAIGRSVGWGCVEMSVPGIARRQISGEVQYEEFAAVMLLGSRVREKVNVT